MTSAPLPANHRTFTAVATPIAVAGVLGLVVAAAMAVMQPEAIPTSFHAASVPEVITTGSLPAGPAEAPRREWIDPGAP